MARKNWILAAVACGTFMATLDASIVNLALSTLTRDLNTDLAHVKWIVIIYFLVITCLLLPFGRVSDQFGHKGVFGIGFGIFTLGSLACGISWNLSWLIFARALQAVGSSMIMTNGPAIITGNFPAKERGAALGKLAMVVSLGLISGPSLGGVLISNFGWRSIFLVNIPIGILGMLMVHFFIPDSKTHRKIFTFDWSGALLQCVFLTAFILAIDPTSILWWNGVDYGMPAWLLAGLAFIFGGIFFLHEKEVKNPVFDLELFRITTFWTAILAGFLIFVAYSAIAVLMPFFLEEVMELSTHQAGFFMTLIPMMIFFFAPLSGSLSDRWGSKELCIAGAFLLTFSFFLIGVFPFQESDVQFSMMIVGVALVLAGIGMGLFQSPNNNAIMGVVPHHKLGAASAIIATVRNLGLVIGTGLSTGLFTWRIHYDGDPVAALHFTYLFSGVITLLAIVFSFGKSKGPHWEYPSSDSLPPPKE